MGRVTPAGVQQPAWWHSPALPTLAPCGCKADPSHSGVRQLPAPPLHAPLPWAARLRYPSRRNGPGRAATGLAGTAGPTPKFPRRAPAADAGGRAGTTAPSRLSQAIPPNICWGGDDECSLIKQNRTPRGEHSGDGVAPGCWGTCCQLCQKPARMGRAGQPPAVGMGLIPQRGWGSSHSRVGPRELSLKRCKPGHIN